jgi:hypothetical protein
MDHLTTLRSVLDLKWDVPYRLLASILTIAAVVAMVRHETPLETLSGLAGWAGWPAAGSGMIAAQEWLSARLVILEIGGLILLVGGIVFAYKGGRGGATAVLGAAALAQAASWLPLVLFSALLVLLVVAKIVGPRYFSILDDPSRYISDAVTSIVGAALYVVLGPLSWAVRG